MIDSHLHVNYRGMGAREIIKYMDRERVDRCWLLTWEETDPRLPSYLSLPIEAVFETFEKYPERIIPMYAPDPARPDAAGRLEEWVKKGVRGCGELKCGSRWDSPEVGRLLGCIDRLGIPLVFHMQEARTFTDESGGGLDRLLSWLLDTKRFGGITGKAIEEAADLFRPLKRKKQKLKRFFPGYLLDFAALEARAAQYPDIKLVGHGPLFWKGFTVPGDGAKEGTLWGLMERCPNLHADLSASGCLTLKKNPAMAKRFLDTFSRRVLYGTDNFFNGLKGFLDSLRLGPDVCGRIYGENAEDLLEKGRTGDRGGLRGPRGRRAREAA